MKSPSPQIPITSRPEPLSARAAPTELPGPPPTPPPASAGAARESVLRAYWLANTAPCGPTYINLDAEVQEGKLPAPLPPIDYKRYMPPVTTGPSADSVKKAADMLLNAKRPLILAGRVSRNIDDWNRRIQLAEALDARVTTNLKVGAAFPTDHPLHIGSPATFVTDDVIAAIKDADCILSLDWVDLAGTLKSIGSAPTAASGSAGMNRSTGGSAS